MKKISFLLTSLLLLTCASTAFAYSDVSDADPYAEAIAWMGQQKVMQGYSDGTFAPNREITRAEFLKTLVTLKALEWPTQEETSCFSDVSISAWYAPVVCFAKDEKLIQGYKDGTFKPEQSVNVVEASKLIMDILEVTPTSTPQGREWYSSALETLGELKVYPSTLNYLNEPLTRGEVAELLWRLETGRTDQEATAWQDFSAECQSFSYDIPSNIDVHAIEDTWLSWMNATRSAQGLAPYTLNDQLKRSATAWSEYSKSLGSMSHKRSGTTAYYDYYAIQDWFAALGLTFKNDAGYTFTENIGHGPYSCDSADCTEDLIDAIRYSYDYFISEAGKSYSPHWNSIVNAHFKEVGIGVTVDSNSYYVTIHYATEITSDPAPLCN